MKPTKTKSKKPDGKAKSKSKIKETKTYALSSTSTVAQKTMDLKKSQHILANLGIPKTRDSKYTVGKYIPVDIEGSVKEQVKKFTVQNDTKRREAKGQFGDYFLKYSSPGIIEDKLPIVKRKANLKVDLSSGIASEVPEKHRKWPYNYRPIICTQRKHNELQSCLNKIFPPKEWTIGGEDWRQSVSPIPAARKEVIDLKETLDYLLKEKNTKVYGLCSVRLDLYLQCFDELIRQVTICCLERGMIMAQVRDTIKSTLWSYHTVYESCCALGLRKTLNHEEELLALSTSISDVIEERNKIREKIVEMEKKIESVKDVFVNHSNVEETKHAQRMVLLKKANDQIKEALLNTAEFGPKKKKVLKGAVAARSAKGALKGRPHNHSLLD